MNKLARTIKMSATNKAKNALKASAVHRDYYAKEEIFSDDDVPYR